MIIPGGKVHKVQEQKLQALTERHGSKAMRLRDNCVSFKLGGSLLSILTIAIFVGSPDGMKVHVFGIENEKFETANSCF